VPRRTRKQCVGKQLENNERREQERELRELGQALRQVQWQQQVAEQRSGDAE
jgi:hypothetical protein